MYCVKCGVELADSQRVCPLCGTRVFHPDIPRTPADPPYPPDERVHPEEVNRSGVCFILTALALLPAVICVLCDWRINGGILWSGYASGGILLLIPSIDETIQLFVPGRAGMITDVMIDCCGAATGVVLRYLLRSLMCAKKAA